MWLCQLRWRENLAKISGTVDALRVNAVSTPCTPSLWTSRYFLIDWYLMQCTARSIFIMCVLLLPPPGHALCKPSVRYLTTQ